MPRNSKVERINKIDEQVAELQAKIDALMQKKSNIMTPKTWTAVKQYATEHGLTAADVLSLLADSEHDDDPQITPRPRRRRRTKAEMEAARAAEAAAAAAAAEEAEEA